MTSRVVLMVDAGFLLKALVIQVGETSRESVAFDHAAISQVLADVVEDQTGTRPMRQLWYDAARDARPRAEHRALAELPGVQIRLGWIIDLKNGGVRQKAVDTLIVRDLLRTAFRRSADEVVLLAGDGDLVPGVQEASEHGVVIHLWGIASPAQVLKQSDELVALADTRLNLDVAELAAFVRVKSQRGSERAVLDASPPSSAAQETAVEETSDVVKSAVSLPPHASTGAPSLRQLLSPDDFKAFWFDDQVDEVDARETGRRYGARWAEHMGLDGRYRFTQRYERPRLPKRVDRDLMETLKDRSIDAEDQTCREAARDGFWDALEAVRSNDAH